MFFRLPIVRFFNKILNRAVITVVLVALQVAWPPGAGRGWKPCSRR